MSWGGLDMEKMREEKNAAIRAIRWQQAHNWLLRNVPISNIGMTGECTTRDVIVGVNREQGVFVCYTHARIHLCKLDKCEYTFPSSGEYCCVCSHNPVEKMLSLFAEGIKRTTGQKDHIDDVVEWRGAQRQRRTAGHGSMLESAPLAISQVVNNALLNKSARQAAAMWALGRRQLPSDWETPPFATEYADWLRSVCYAVWRMVEQNGQNTTMTKTRCRNVTLYTLSRLAEVNFCVSSYLIVSTTPWLKEYLPTEAMMCAMGLEYIPAHFSSGKKDFSSSFFALERTGRCEDFFEDIPKISSHLLNPRVENQ